MKNNVLEWGTKKPWKNWKKRWMLYLDSYSPLYLELFICLCQNEICLPAETPLQPNCNLSKLIRDQSNHYSRCCRRWIVEDRPIILQYSRYNSNKRHVWIKKSWDSRGFDWLLFMGQMSEVRLKIPCWISLMANTVFSDDNHYWDRWDIPNADTLFRKMRIIWAFNALSTKRSCGTKQSNCLCLFDVPPRQISYRSVRKRLEAIKGFTELVWI